MKLYFDLITLFLIVSTCVGCKSTIAEEQSGKHDSNLFLNQDLIFKIQFPLVLNVWRDACKPMMLIL